MFYDLETEELHIFVSEKKCENIYAQQEKHPKDECKVQEMNGMQVPNRLLAHTYSVL